MVPRKKVPSYSGSERRNNSRIPFWAMVAVDAITGEEVQASSGIPSHGFASCVNVSDNGMFLESFDKFGIGTLLRLELEWPHEAQQDNLHFLGRVMHTQRVDRSSMNGLGIRLLERPDGFLDQILSRSPDFSKS